jgi:hypothetical protein
MKLRTAVALIAALALAGCAGMNSVVSDVSSYSQWPAARVPGSYVFERLPSQQAKAPLQDTLEAAARDALAHAGFTEAKDAQSADVQVQLGARIHRWDPWPYYADPFWGRWGWGRPRYGWWGPPMVADTPRYEREVAVLMRDRRTGQVLYETRASNESLSGGDGTTFAAMFEAALKDFPQPAVNPRRVSIPLAKQ